MKIIKKYFDQAQREFKEIERELEQEKKRKTQNELANEKRILSIEGRKLFHKLKMIEHNTSFVRNKEKYDRFVMLYEKAMQLAKLLNLNVEINTENPYHSTIEFTTDNFYLVKDVPQEYHAFVATLFMYADDVWIDKKENLIRMIFFFQVNDMLKK